MGNAGWRSCVHRKREETERLMHAASTGDLCTVQHLTRKLGIDTQEGACADVLGERQSRLNLRVAEIFGDTALIRASQFARPNSSPKPSCFVLTYRAGPGRSGHLAGR